LSPCFICSAGTYRRSERIRPFGSSGNVYFSTVYSFATAGFGA
jgi:hypothetical protein